MKFKELENKTEKDIQKMLTEAQSRLLELRFKVAANSLKNVREIRKLKKDVARMLTKLSAMQTTEEK